MCPEIESNFTEFDGQKDRIKQFVNDSFSEVLLEVINRNPYFPRVCGHVSALMEEKIKTDLGVNVKFCQGSRCDNQSNCFCDFHCWLEYKDLIIDPTDFQFSIPTQNLGPTIQVEDQTYRKKEYFQHLHRLVITNPNKISFFVDQIKEHFGCKIFYSKTDPQYIYKDYLN